MFEVGFLPTRGTIRLMNTSAAGSAETKPLGSGGLTRLEMEAGVRIVRRIRNCIYKIPDFIGFSSIIILTKSYGF